MSAKSPAAAGVIAALVPGVGHAYVGHPLRGAAWLVAPVLTVVGAGLFASEASGAMVKAIFGSLAVVYVVQIVDAVLLAKRAPRETSAAMVGGLALVSALVLPVMLGLLARNLVVEAFKVPSGSMIPSLPVGVHLFADKIVYRKREPRRGEMMVFRYPEHPDQSFVKRVIGLPGDKIEARGGHPMINGWEVPSCPVGTYTYQEEQDGTGHAGELFIEFLDEEAFFVFLDRSSFENDYQGPFVFDGYFVMGDNRNNAHDSRMWNGGQGGGVPKDHVQGRARYQWLPSLADYASPPVAPLPELTAAVERCLKERPPRDKTSPPKR